jgi:hypothetical protein
MRGNEDPTVVEHEVHEQLQASLPEVDPFWVRWRYWRTQDGSEGSTP